MIANLRRAAALFGAVTLILVGCNGFQALKRAADHHFERGEWEAARERYKEACTRYNWVATACFRWGLVAQQLKAYEEAKQAYRMTLLAQPRTPAAHNNLGAIAWIQRDLATAEQHFRRALELDRSNSIEARNNLGMVLLKRGKARHALELLENAKHKWPRPQVMSTLRTNLGRAYFQLGQYRESLSEYRQAIEIDPKNVHAHNNLGVIYAKLRRFHSARLHLVIVRKLRPDDGGSYYNLGIVAFLEGQYRESVRSNLDALKRAPRHLHAYNNVAMAYYRLGDFTRANGALVKSLRIDTRYGAAYNGLAVLAIARTDYKQAIRLLGKAIDLMPRVATFHFNLGLSHFKTRAYRKALTAFEQAHALDPKLPGVLENITALRTLIDTRSGGITLPHSSLRWRIGGGRMR